MDLVILRVRYPFRTYIFLIFNLASNNAKRFTLKYTRPKPSSRFSRNLHNLLSSDALHSILQTISICSGQILRSTSLYRTNNKRINTHGNTIFIFGYPKVPTQFPIGNSLSFSSILTQREKETQSHSRQSLKLHPVQTHDAKPTAFYEF